MSVEIFFLKSTHYYITRYLNIIVQRGSLISNRTVKQLLHYSEVGPPSGWSGHGFESHLLPFCWYTLRTGLI